MIKQIKKKLFSLITITALVYNSFPPIYAKAEIVFGTEQSDVVENKSVTTIEPQIIKEILEKQALLNNQEKQYLNGWTTTKVNVREYPNINATILTTFDFNTFIEYIEFNDEWVKIKYEENVAYIAKDYISNEECLYQEYKLPEHEDFKSFMGYEFITNISSDQFSLQKNYAYTGDYGIRMINNRYCVAIGSYFNTEIGQYFDLVLENGIIIPCIMGDLKADKDTDSSNIFTSNGCCSEFIVDSTTLHSTAKLTGNISDLNKNWNSPVIKIKVYNNILN